MDLNPYRSPLKMPSGKHREVGGWLLALAVGAAIGVVFASVALPI